VSLASAGLYASLHLAPDTPTPHLNYSKKLEFSGKPVRECPLHMGATCMHWRDKKLENVTPPAVWCHVSDGQRHNNSLQVDSQMKLALSKSGIHLAHCSTLIIWLLGKCLTFCHDDSTINIVLVSYNNNVQRIFTTAIKSCLKCYLKLQHTQSINWSTIQVQQARKLTPNTMQKTGH